MERGVELPEADKEPTEVDIIDIEDVVAVKVDNIEVVIADDEPGSTRDFKIEKQLARHIVYYSKCISLSNLLPFNAIHTINSFLNLIISANHEKGRNLSQW